VRNIVTAALCLAALACGKSSTEPSDPGGNNNGTTPPACRTFATAYMTAFTGQPVTSNVTTTCGFSIVTNQLSCTHVGTSSDGESGTITTVTTYASRGDAVDEIAVIPPLRRAQSMLTSYPFETDSITYAYDASKRLATEQGQGTTTYTAWDTAGRPTAGSRVGGPTSTTTTKTLSYNNANRTLVTVDTTAGTSSTCTTVFDANGIQLSRTCGAGASLVVATTTLQTTAQFCR
jgi:hypothetical protein